MGSRENLVVTACTKVLDIHGIPWLRNNSRTVQMPGRGGKMRPVFFGKPGWPDIIAILPDGRFLGIEAKAPAATGLFKKRAAGKLSDLQKAVHRQLLHSNALILTVTSSAEMEQDLQCEGYFR